MNSNTLLDLAEIYQDISENSHNFISESEDSETPRRRRPRPTGTTSQQRARLDALRKKSARRETAIADVLEPTQALGRHEKEVEAAKSAEEARQRAASAEVIARRKEAERRRAQGLPPAPKPKAPKPKVTKLASQTTTEPDAPTEHDIATGRRLGRRGTTTPETKPEDPSKVAADKKKKAEAILAQLRGESFNSFDENEYMMESRKGKNKKGRRWWDDDGDGIGWEPGEVSGSFKRKPRVAKEEYSNWREDLVELSGILENQKKK